MPNYGSKEQFYKDVLTTWRESGLGLWAAPISTVRDVELNVLSVKVQDAEDEDEQEHTVTLDTIQTGFARIRANEVKALHESHVKRIAGAYAATDAGDIDADYADVVVQAGLFNEIIYG